ncbi:sigma-70 family RNA polymerase sigma factor [Pontibacillus yanchengensis]|uniref:RNA polymerase factor sigma C n=1 Tax=Pontibacillus yanchengensis Y32 TaxID=1385514 RepID=A0A0A2TCI5_9BACI|nr:sigma-70 family RNA polymerase sigma factor [Pontibacillus yanchengensis]KGP71776.1 RNA polymerase factor sigma C [Pontibacillus yanchengensis Y32]
MAVMTIELTDSELKEICKDESRREQFLEQLIDEYSQSVLWLAYTYVKDVQLAEETMQDVFMTCYRKIELFRNDSSIKTWIYRVTVNKCKDQLRKKTIKRFLSREEKTEDYYGSSKEHPEQEILSKIEDQKLADKVMALPTKFKEVIFMHYFEEMKVKEMSEILKMNENTIKTRLNRGRALLKEMYEKEGLDED